MNKILTKSSILFASLFCYFLVVEVLVIICKPALFLSVEMFANRMIFVGIFILSYLLKPKLNHKNWALLTVVLTYASLSFLYKETALLNQLFYPAIDGKLLLFELKIWGFQPSLRFSEMFDNKWISELLFFGYFSYYLMPLAVIGLVYRTNYKQIESFGFILITSFLIYYTIFIFLPAWGPQFYLEYPQNHIEAQGVFGNIIKIIQENGEAKTAAFPSSHIGISVIVLIWLRKNLKKYFAFFIPTTILLTFATVYIKAHYTVDVLAGFATAPIVYFISNQCLRKIRRTQ
ncbi:MAG: phosphatase PAP2 family protein [Flavobacteriaceae bacterium]|nr:phosphatase PAP2 family protein [Flavobacteriaceae bacterium]